MSYRKSNQEEMYSFVERYLSRSNTQEEFCKDNNISKSTLGYWIVKYNKEKNNSDISSNGFVKLTPSEPSLSQITVTLPNGIRLCGSGNNFNSSVSEIYNNTL